MWAIYEGNAERFQFWKFFVLRRAMVLIEQVAIHTTIIAKMPAHTCDRNHIGTIKAGLSVDHRVRAPPLTFR